MDHVALRTPHKADEINVMEVAQKLLTRWRIIVFCMALASLAGLLTLHLATYTYTAELKITPVQSTQNATALRRQLGGLASLAGLSLPNSQEETPFFLYVESVTSRAVADDLAKNTDLMKVIFKAEWDKEANRFVKTSSRFESTTDTIKELIGIPSYPWTPPDGAQLQLYLIKAVIVDEDTRKPIVTLTYDHEDPAFAVSFLTALNHAIDTQLRQKTLTRVNENIVYLSKQLPTVTLTEQRQAIIEELIQQEKVRMAASSDAPIAAEIVSGPNASFRPTKPRPMLVFAGALFAGLLFGIIAALVREWFAHHRVARVASLDPPETEERITVSRFGKTPAR